MLTKTSSGQQFDKDSFTIILNRHSFVLLQTDAGWYPPIAFRNVSNANPDPAADPAAGAKAKVKGAEAEAAAVTAAESDNWVLEIRALYYGENSSAVRRHS